MFSTSLQHLLAVPAFTRFSLQNSIWSLVSPTQTTHANQQHLVLWLPSLSQRHSSSLISKVHVNSRYPQQHRHVTHRHPFQDSSSKVQVVWQFGMYPIEISRIVLAQNSIRFALISSQLRFDRDYLWLALITRITLQVVPQIHLSEKKVPFLTLAASFQTSYVSHHVLLSKINTKNKIIIKTINKSSEIKIDSYLFIEFKCFLELNSPHGGILFRTLLQSNCF